MANQNDAHGAAAESWCSCRVRAARCDRMLIFGERHLHRVCGAENSVTSCNLHVLVYEAVEPVSSQRSDCCAGA